jgi:hypothetical protein
MMKQLIIIVLTIISTTFCKAQSPVGKWKIISHISSFGGETFDSQEALLQQRPCAANIIYEVNEDKSYRLNAASSGCDEKYKTIQEKLYSKTKWKLEGGIISISATGFAVSQSYKVSFSGNRMIWNGTEGQGTIVYQKL